MSENGDKEKKAKPITLKGFTAILMELDSEAAHTSFGKLPLSKELSEPQFGFPTAKKTDQVFVSEEHARVTNACKHSPGPANYDIAGNEAKY